MNSLVSEKKVICNESIPNPITPVPIPITIDSTETKTVTILSGSIIKPKVNKISEETAVNGNQSERERNNKEKEIKEETTMNTDTSLSNESSLSPSEPMDCNSTPNASPAHANKFVNESNEDVAMSENSVSNNTFWENENLFSLFADFERKRWWEHAS